MEDEAYHSGNLSSGNVSGEIAGQNPAGEGLNLEGLGGPALSPLTQADTIEDQTGQPGSRIPDLPLHVRKRKSPTSRLHREAVTTHNVISPTTHLVGRMDLINLATGKRPAEATDSPTSEYGSGNFPSLPENDELTSLDKKSRDLENPTGRTLLEDAGTKAKLSGISEERLSRPSVRQGRERSVSPSVPPIGESIEVETWMEQEMMRPEGAMTAKRTADGEFISSKSRRLAEVTSASFGGATSTVQPIRVSTIVSAGTAKLVARGGGRREGMEGMRLTSERLEAHSPVRITVDDQSEMETAECEVKTERLVPVRTARIFENISELSKSDRPPVLVARRAEECGEGEDVERDNPSGTRNHTLSEMYVGVPPVNLVDSGSAFLERRSPKPVESPLPVGSPMAIENLISPRNSKRSASPGHGHLSPISPHSPRSPYNDKKSSTDPSEKKDNKPGAQALLQVSEAHLAILPDEDGDTPLHLAIIHENFTLTQYLIQLIVGVHMNLDIANNMRQTPLHLAVITRQPHMVQALVAAGASVNFPDRKGNTSLHLAAQRRDVRILQLLSRATSPLPDFNLKNFSGLTPVHVATKEASIDVLKFLFQMGANKNAADACSGRTPLHYAVEAENFILVNFLLENGANVNAATFAGNTPLHIGAGRRLKEIVALLMAYGANPAIANGEGDFPSDLPASLLMQRAKMNAH